ncbi:MAG: hypothetical protein H7Y11_03035 [Armatimonadetes bacterium]|nr:hypothetical protein [Anaerolineae bacterium]
MLSFMLFGNTQPNTPPQSYRLGDTVGGLRLVAGAYATAAGAQSHVPAWVLATRLGASTPATSMLEAAITRFEANIVDNPAGMGELGHTLDNGTLSDISSETPNINNLIRQSRSRWCPRLP